MSLPLAGKVALITGGSKGIGKATAIALHKLGASIAINYGRDNAAAQELVTQLGGESRAFAIQADAGTIAGVSSIVSQTVAHFHKIDILIPNAGVLMMKTVSTTSEEDFDRSYNLNVKGPFFLVQKAIPHMPTGDGSGSTSSIIFLSTTINAASTVPPPYTLYCSTKGAVEQLTRTIAKDLAPKSINVNCVAPGPTGTDLFFEGKSEQFIKTIAAQNPRNRIGTPEEVADAIAFLTTPAARWVTGQVLRVNGGQA